jgi:hypothetical protein
VTDGENHIQVQLLQTILLYHHHVLKDMQMDSHVMQDKLVDDILN